MATCFEAPPWAAGTALRRRLPAAAHRRGRASRPRPTSRTSRAGRSPGSSSTATASLASTSSRASSKRRPASRSPSRHSNADLQRLENLGLFAETRVIPEADGDGVRLTVTRPRDAAHPRLPFLHLYGGERLLLRRRPLRPEPDRTRHQPAPPHVPISAAPRRDGPGSSIPGSRATTSLSSSSAASGTARTP